MAGDNFDRFLLHTRVGTHKKLRRLTDSEWRAIVGGAFALAGESPIKGLLLIEEGEPATAQDVAEHAGTTLEASRNALEKAQKLKILVTNDEHDCLEVRDWWQWNQPPRNDPTAAERMRRYRSGKRSKRNDDDALRNADRNALRDTSRNDESEVTSPLINARNARSTSSSSSVVNSEDTVPAIGRARFDEILEQLQSAWPAERCRPRNAAHVRTQFEQQIGLDLELAELVLEKARSQVEAFGWDDDFEHCPNLHKWLEERRWRDRIPGKTKPPMDPAAAEDLEAKRRIMQGAAA